MPSILQVSKARRSAVPCLRSIRNASCEDRTHDLRIMRPTRYRLRQRSCRYDHLRNYVHVRCTHPGRTLLSNGLYVALWPQQSSWYGHLRRHSTDVHYTVSLDKLTAVGFEPTRIAPSELESDALDHSATLSCIYALLTRVFASAFELRSRYHPCKLRTSKVETATPRSVDLGERASGARAQVVDLGERALNT